MNCWRPALTAFLPRCLVMPETRALAGRCVVVTRPAPQAGGLIDALRAAGADAFFFPVIDILPLADTAPLAALNAELGNFDAAFFVSRNAVAQALAVLPRKLWPARMLIATVGPGSAEALRAAGFEHVTLPTEQFDSEGVLALEAFSPQNIAGKRVLILRGDGGRELLAEQLLERGAQVHLQSAYRRVPAQTDPQALLAQFAAGRIDALSFTSSEGARNFAAMLGAQAGNLFAGVPCFVPHQRIASQVQELGAQTVCLTAAGDAGLVTALQQHFG